MAEDLTAPAGQVIAVEQSAAEQEDSATRTAVPPITPVASLAEVLGTTLKAIECGEALRPDDPALAELKHSVLRILAELEVLKAKARAPTQEEPV
jgi:hypothetical protein